MPALLVNVVVVFLGASVSVSLSRVQSFNAQLLILDEATSALDYLTERQVCLNLKKAFEGSAVFFITHRLSTIRSADRILMMDSGSLVEEGTHQELIQQQGRYFAFIPNRRPILTDTDMQQTDPLSLCLPTCRFGRAVLCGARSPLVIRIDMALFSPFRWNLDLGVYRKN